MSLFSVHFPLLCISPLIKLNQCFFVAAAAAVDVVVAIVFVVNVLTVK